ncbi:bifunctional DNA-binding transcriptional regulator/O6-methylguanine-DNA methyltransferase Ada [Salinisphaera sp. P385]|uniref:Bifunctional DNA-binding transcriptional regulator/O6-methylguanine-DNA methyltransferase Ada n=1 Tax=Spectribacter acetivorans TaxID=3075603 RepID=A0ABU3BB29_9GAMM|nr:bifunctional DNA-binding transcriptional regulator/O6-methylguanine-DNA methyltransferase Ada [Salinisphaera sp. P385]MDT0619658.1 bifunctional DNA-binding transcriptional regulator/O6-methylguanine-DNA methyltransferase Ada [Salinisphaera sp. P385]
MSTPAPDSATNRRADAARWAAITARDSTADGHFFYGVTTTGVYCRPSCPSRAARRENVRFFTDGAAAAAAGFRACKRCRPDLPASTNANVAVVAAACRFIETADTAPGLDAIAAHVGFSPSHFHRLFKRLTGLTPRQYAAAHREQRLRQELRGGAPVTRAIFEAGYGSSGRFYEQADAVLGMTPGDFRAGGTNTAIRFAVGQSSLGAILVAASQRGICAIYLGDDPEALTHELQDRFPHAELVGGDRDFEQLVARVVGLVESPETGADLPLDIRGTAFQQRVWEALRAIPPGETASYTDIAARIGRPKSVRAVAGACAANQLAVAIPCHRVVRSDGNLSGYRWGVDRKRKLLTRERRT